MKRLLISFALLTCFAFSSGPEMITRFKRQSYLNPNAVAFCNAQDKYDNNEENIFFCEKGWGYTEQEAYEKAEDNLYQKFLYFWILRNQHTNEHEVNEAFERLLTYLYKGVVASETKEGDWVISSYCVVVGVRMAEIKEKDKELYRIIID